MTYAVKEIYYTLQGEGANVGRPAVFLRFAGCNLWSGFERDRSKGPGGCSQWCDTDFVGTDGTRGGKFTSAVKLADEVTACLPEDVSRAGTLVVCTGGEPLLQLDSDLIDALHARGCSVSVETNGTLDPPKAIDWLTVSPKEHAKLRALRGQELKLVYPQTGIDPSLFQHLGFEYFFLQPMDGSNLAENTRLAIAYCLRHPQWRLSVQTHKAIGIP